MKWMTVLLMTSGVKSCQDGGYLMERISSSCEKNKYRIISIVLFLVLTSVLAQSVSGATLNLTATWTANADPNMREYRLYRTDGTRTLLGSTPYPNTSYPFAVTVSDGSAGTLTFVVTAVDKQNDESTDSNLAAYNYDLRPTTYTVSGYVRTSGGVGISGVVMGGLSNSPITDANGYYSDTVSYGWSGTVAPSKSGCSFSPASRSYSNVTSNQTGQDYTGTLPTPQTFTISGNTGVAGATLSYTDGTPKTATADGSGNYSFTVSNNWSGIVTPSKSGYTFSPASRSYSNVLSNQSGQNYTATAITFTISGNTGVAGATLSYTDSTPKTATADGSGNYSFTVSNNWSGTVTPSKSGYSFSPASRSYSNVTSNQTGQNYTGTETASEVISTPKIPSGASSAYMGTSYKFTTSGSSSSLASSHPVEYQFDWGDGTFSSWGSPYLGTYSQSHVWTVPGTYSVKALARCKNHPTNVSAWSSSSSISARGKPFIQVTSPNGGENLIVGNLYTITWNAAYLNPSGTVYLFYWCDGSWHPIATLSPGASSFNWTIPRIPGAVTPPRPSTFVRSTSLWIGNWVDGKWECHDKNDYNFRILYDGWLCKISRGDQGGATIILDNGVFDGYGISLGLGMFSIAGTYGLNAQGGISGAYTIYEFANPASVFYTGNVTGSINSTSKRLTLGLTTSDGKPVFNLAGTRLVNDPVVPGDWTGTLSGSVSGTLNSLAIDPYQIETDIYSYMFDFRGAGFLSGGGSINITGYFYLTSTTVSRLSKTNGYGIYQITGAINETGIFTASLNPSTGTLSFAMTGDSGGKSTLAGNKVTP